MILSFRCPPQLKNKIDEIVFSGLYPDFSSFCIAALENQLLLEQAHSKAGGQAISVVPNTGSNDAAPSAYERPKKTAASHSQKRKRHQKPDLQSRSSPADLRVSGDGGDLKSEHGLQLISSHVSSDLTLARLDAQPPFPLPSMFADMFQPDREIPVDRWLFGQYNRLLPAKISLRALAVISMEGRDSLLLEEVAQRIAEEASRFGSYLHLIDRRFGNHRDDALATAFPELGIEGQKGRLRYQNHFVGHTVRGEQGGLLVGLKLAVIQVIKNKPHILPTVAGWEFARLPNPLLDAEATSDHPKRMSDEESAYLLNHIRQHVPVELFAYRVTLSLILEGRNTPELLNQVLARNLSPGKDPQSEQDLVSTQRTGVLGRMTDLGLVARERQSTRIIYHLTPDGRKFLDEIEAILSKT